MILVAPFLVFHNDYIVQAKTVFFQPPLTRGIQLINNLIIHIYTDFFQPPLTREMQRYQYHTEISYSILSTPTHAGNATILRSQGKTIEVYLSTPTHAGNATKKELNRWKLKKLTFNPHSRGECNILI